MLVIEPDGTIKLGKQRVDAKITRRRKRFKSDFLAPIAGRDSSFSISFYEQPILGYMRVTELVIDGTEIPIVDKR
jgi:hypothetical protein